MVLLSEIQSALSDSSFASKFHRTCSKSRFGPYIKTTPLIAGGTMRKTNRIYRSKRGEIEVKKTDEYEYEARSQSKDNKWCRIAYVLGRWCCSCKDFAHTCRACKHIAAVKKVFDASPPPRPRLNRNRRRPRGRIPAIETPGIKCRFCRKSDFGKPYMRKNKHGKVQVYRCHRKKCGRRFTHDDGFLYMTYRGEVVIVAIEDRCGGKTTHSIVDSLRKEYPELARSIPHTWLVKFPRLAGPYLMSLDYHLSPVMPADEIMVQIGGVRHAIVSSEDEGTRFDTAIQFGRFKGSHSVQGLYKLDMHVRGSAPELVRMDGARNFASAHNAVLRHNDNGTTSFHIGHIHADGDMNTNMKERHNDTTRDFVDTCRGLKTAHTTYVGMHQIHYNFVRMHTGLGMRPSEAAGVRFADKNKWRAVIACSADHNADAEARRRKKTSRTDLPRQVGLQVVPRFRR